MRDSEAAISAFYDYEQEQPGTRRRNAPDWGADEVFATTPRRRLSRRDADHSHGVRPHVAASRERAARPAVERGPAPAGTQELPAPVEHTAAAATLDLQLAPPPAAPAEPAPEPQRAPNGRRTVVVTGRPGLVAAPARRRPPRTVDERVGMRPDRVAGWAFGMGLVLIGVAAATASAAPV